MIHLQQCWLSIRSGPCNSDPIQIKTKRGKMHSKILQPHLHTKRLAGPRLNRIEQIVMKTLVVQQHRNSAADQHEQDRDASCHPGRNLYR